MSGVKIHKRPYYSGKFSLALPLQQCNLQFLDIFKIGTGGSVYQVNYTLRILVEDCRAFVCSGVSLPTVQTQERESVILNQNNLYCWILNKRSKVKLLTLKG